MMRTPGDWPNWPLLPVKRPDPRFSNGGRGTTYKQFGLMVAVPDRLHLVYWAAWSRPRRQGAAVADALDPLERIEYDSYEAIAADGWIVD